jgi:hypothetical protein
MTPKREKPHVSRPKSRDDLSDKPPAHSQRVAVPLRLRSQKPEDIQDAEGDGGGGDKIYNVKQVEEIAAMLSLQFVHAGERVL